MEAVEKIASQIKQLKTKGFKFAIDDFGTGHASLTYLKNLPVNEVKIDQEFIREIFNEPNSLSIIEAIKSMAEAFNLSVVAEGAETSEHIELLLQLGVKSVQGYAIAKPMNEADMTVWINEWKMNPKWSNLKEVAPHNKQLLKARLAHNAWLNKVDKALENGNAEKYVHEDSDKTCEFGLWLHSHGTKVLDKDTFQSVDSVHQEIHQLARQALKKSNKTKTSLNELSLIKEKSTELSELIKSFEA